MVDDHLGAQGFSEPRFEGGDIRIPAAAATAALATDLTTLTTRHIWSAGGPMLLFL